MRRQSTPVCRHFRTRLASSATAARRSCSAASGLPEFDGRPLPQRPEFALFLLRRDYELYANLRPVRVFAGLEDASSLKPELVRGLDLVVVRELTGGIYSARRKSSVASTASKKPSIR